MYHEAAPGENKRRSKGDGRRFGSVRPLTSEVLSPEFKPIYFESFCIQRTDL